MKRLAWLFILLLFVYTNRGIADNSYLQFSPRVDTLILTSGCTEPLLSYRIVTDSLGPDSLIFTAGFNTRLQYVDSIGTEHLLEQCAVIMTDSLEHPDYSVVYQPIDTIWIYNSSFAVPPDTEIAFWKRFYLTVYVSENGVIRDSLSQIWRAIQFGIGVEPETPIITHIQLAPNYPNPFNASTNIHYVLARKMDVQLNLYDLRGYRVWSKQLSGQPPGSYSYRFNAHGLSSGVYIFQIQTPWGHLTQRWLYLK